MSETLEYLKMFAQLPAGLRRFLREPVTLEQAREIVRGRMARREQNFLGVVEGCVYGYAASPYLALLKNAHCELGDVKGLVERGGLECALETLRQAGVYISFDEFKGREPIVRDGLELNVTPQDFDNPKVQPSFATSTGGSTGLANTVYMDLDYTASGAVTYLLTLESHGARNVPMLQWMPILPGGGIHFILQMLYLGLPITEWYTNIGWRDSREWLKYSAAMWYMLVCMRASGARFPMPQVLRATEALTFAKRLREVLDQDGICLIQAGTSLALRVCVAAEQADIVLDGAVFRIGGEPLTEAKADIIRRRGARVLVHYGAIDAGSIGLSCANPKAIDEVHLNMSVYAMTTHPHTLPESGQTVPVVTLTQLLANAPKILLNYQTDDFAVVSERNCGCALQELGMTTHLHEIRSYSKLVGESVTLIGTEMVRILEEALPARFGGTPLDYQLVEHEDAQGFTRLVLYIHPRLDLPEEGQVVNVVMQMLRESSAAADTARIIWQQAETLQIERKEPILTTHGKFLPLYRQRGSTNQEP